MPTFLLNLILTLVTKFGIKLFETKIGMFRAQIGRNDVPCMFFRNKLLESKFIELFSKNGTVGLVPETI